MTGPAEPRTAALTTALREERRRVARELHDGVAQQVVALGYLVDDVACLVDTESARTAVIALRDEVSRVTHELRRSVADLRTEVGVEDGLADGLSGALSSYVGELGHHCDLRIHLHLDERGARPPRHVEREVLRIAQEAIANVRQHARAINLWVRLTTDAHQLRLVVEDDGIGNVAPREGHFGLVGMRERAERIDGALEVGVRPDGGTVVTLHTGVATAPTMEGDSDDRQRLARR